VDELSQEEINYFRELLIQVQYQLQQVVESADVAARRVELDQSRIGRLSRMDALQAQAMSQESNRRRDEELRRIASALQRMEAGEYGYCQGCGELIARGCLEADPTASLCIRCASKAESRSPAP
jgi:DnaK suppressor protein